MSACANCGISILGLKYRVCVCCNESYCTPCCPFMIPTTCAGTCVKKITKEVFQRSSKAMDGTILMFTKQKNGRQTNCTCMDVIKAWRNEIRSKNPMEQMREYFMCHLCGMVDFVTLSDYELVKYMLLKCGTDNIEDVRKQALLFKRNNTISSRTLMKAGKETNVNDSVVIDEVKNIMSFNTSSDTEE